MTFISYAQNFEDVMLWRALKHVAQGFWIDVGAAHPDEFSVTRAFSDHGWRGINVEANPPYVRRIAGARPRDVTLAVAAGVSTEPVRFFEVVGTGLSTMDRAIADQHRSAGFEILEHQVPSRTLASICAEHAPPDVHFLKIDVEGAERDVLAGADFVRYRPWIVLLEATKPMSQEQNHADWEPLLLSADYRFVWFDGLNRFYIAAEHWDALSPAFAAPPNVFDDFIRATDSEHLNKIIDAEARAERAEARTTQADARAAQAEASAARAEARASDAAAAARRAEARMVQLEAVVAHEASRAAAAASRADDADARLAQVYASTSWRITRPMRAVRGLMSGQAEEPTPTPAGTTRMLGNEEGGAKTAHPLQEGAPAATGPQIVAASREAAEVQVEQQGVRADEGTPAKRHRLMRRVLRAGYAATLRPAIRPLLWRLRGFMTAPVIEELRAQDHRRSQQTSTASTLDQAPAASSAGDLRLAQTMEAALLTLALDGRPDPGEGLRAREADRS